MQRLLARLRYQHVPPLPPRDAQQQQLGSIAGKWSEYRNTRALFGFRAHAGLGILGIWYHRIWLRWRQHQSQSSRFGRARATNSDRLWALSRQSAGNDTRDLRLEYDLSGRCLRGLSSDKPELFVEPGIDDECGLLALDGDNRGKLHCFDHATQLRQRFTADVEYRRRWNDFSEMHQYDPLLDRPRQRTICKRQPTAHAGKLQLHQLQSLYGRGPDQHLDKHDIRDNLHVRRQYLRAWHGNGVEPERISLWARATANLARSRSLRRYHRRHRDLLAPIFPAARSAGRLDG